MNHMQKDALRRETGGVFSYVVNAVRQCLLTACS